MQTIVSDLRMFTHPGVTPEQLEPWCQRGQKSPPPALHTLLSNEWKDDVVQIEQDIAERQTIFGANKNKLIHVLVNLLQNALDAYAEGKQFS